MDDQQYAQDPLIATWNGMFLNLSRPQTTDMRFGMSLEAAVQLAEWILARHVEDRLSQP